MVFISHTTSDKRDHILAKNLADGLCKSGSQVWIAPDNIPVGSEWKQEIVSSIMKKSTHFLVILSSASITSEWVQKEIGLAKQRRGQDSCFIILPLFVGTLDLYPGSDFIDLFQRVPFRDNPSDQLEEVIKGLYPRPIVPVCDNSLDHDLVTVNPKPNKDLLDEEKKMPLPDAGLNRRPLSQPAFFLNSPNSKRDKPIQKVKFNLEMFLGLERKGFLCIVAGFDGDGLFKSLRSVEKELQEHLSKHDSYNMPIRWWIKNVLDDSISPPRNESDVWKHITDNDSIKKYLVEKGRPDFVIPGIVFEIRDQNFHPALLQNLYDWCSTLITKVFANIPVAILVDFLCSTDSTINKILESLNEIETYLIESDRGINRKSIIKVMLTETCEHLNQPAQKPLSHFKKVELKGFYLCSWIAKSLNTSHENFEDSIDKDSELFRFYNQCAHSVSEPSDDIFISERFVVKDLDTYVDSFAQEDKSRKSVLYRQLLEFTEKYSPHKLYKLVEAYASSDNTEAYRQALSFACARNDMYSEILIDIFLSGIKDTDTQKKFSQSFEDDKSEWLIPINSKERFVDSLALGLLRQKNDLQKLVKMLEYRLSKSVQLVANFRLGKTDEEIFWRNYKPNSDILSYLINSGAKLVPTAQNRNKILGADVYLLSVCLLSFTECLVELFDADKENLYLWGFYTAEDFASLDKECYENLSYWRNYLPFESQK